MIARTSFALAAFAALAAPAFAQATDGAQPAIRNGDQRLICRTLREIGTRLGGYRACHTAQEWAELRRQTQANIDHIQNSRAWRAE